MFKILFLGGLLVLFCLSALQATNGSLVQEVPKEHIEMAAGFGGPPISFQR